MKKIFSCIMVLTLALSLAACGGKAQSATYMMEQEKDGLKMKDSMTLEAKGDRVEKITEVLTLDISQFDEETQAALTEAYDAIAESYLSVEGVECTVESGDGIYTMNIVIDATGDAVSALADMGLMEVDGNSDGISLEMTGEALTASGYTLVE